MAKLKYCEISNKAYGQKWQHFKLHYVGARPKLIRDDGAFSSGKSLLEALATKFRQFELILTPEESRIQNTASSPQVYLALPELRNMNALLITRKRNVTQRAVSHLLSGLFPKYFAAGTRPWHSARRAGPGKSKPRLGLRALQQLAKDLEERIKTEQSESLWQDYLRQNILSIQKGYIELIPKDSVGLPGASYPDFLLVTYEGCLDILEVKTPSTALLTYDKDHQHHSWSREIAAAIVRVENYIQAVSELGDKLRDKVKDSYGIELRVINPRGIIFAGHSAQFKGNKPIQDDFGRLNQALKNVTVVTYDELLMRLQNYITVLKR